MSFLCRHKDNEALDDFSSWYYPGPPHNLDTWQFDLKQEVVVEQQHPLITRAGRGDLIRVMIYVEDRHGLEVRDFQMTLLHKNPLPTEEPAPTEESKKTQSKLNRFWGRLSSIL